MRTILGLAAPGLILLFAGLNWSLALQRRKCATAFPGNLPDFGLVIRRGWRLALKNWLVAVSLLGFGLFSVVQRAIFRWIYFRHAFGAPFWAMTGMMMKLRTIMNPETCLNVVMINLEIADCG